MRIEENLQPKLTPFDRIQVTLNNHERVKKDFYIQKRVTFQDSKQNSLRERNIVVRPESPPKNPALLLSNSSSNGIELYRRDSYNAEVLQTTNFIQERSARNPTRSKHASQRSLTDDSFYQRYLMKDPEVESERQTPARHQYYLDRMLQMQAAMKEQDLALRSKNMELRSLKTKITDVGRLEEQLESNRNRDLDLKKKVAEYEARD